VEQGHANVNQATNDGASPLYIAAQKGHMEVVKWLVEQGHANVSDPSNAAALSLYHSTTGRSLVARRPHRLAHSSLCVLLAARAGHPRRLGAVLCCSRHTEWLLHRA
jgi:ankyrin repeat protein